MRALNWLINNRPLGESFISNWGGTCSVILQGAFGEIQRAKNKTHNSYSVDSTQLGKAETLTAFGTGVPDDIQELLNFAEVNLQKQFNAPFLLSETPGEVQRILNKIAHLDIIDKTLTNIESKRRSTVSRLKVLEETKTKGTEELKRFAGLDIVKTQLDSLKEKINKKVAIKQDTEGLTEYQQRLSIYKIEISNLMSITIYDEKIKTLLENEQALQIQKTEQNGIENAISYIKKCDEKIHKLKKMTSVTPAIIALSEKIKKLAEEDQKEIALQEIFTKAHNLREKRIKAKKDFDALEIEYSFAFPDICPLCEQEIKR